MTFCVPRRSKTPEVTECLVGSVRGAGTAFAPSGPEFTAATAPSSAGRPTVLLAWNYKTGLVFLAWLAGHQDAFVMVRGAQSARSLPHLAEVFLLADYAGLLPIRPWRSTASLPCWPCTGSASEPRRPALAGRTGHGRPGGLTGDQPAASAGTKAAAFGVPRPVTGSQPVVAGKPGTVGAAAPLLPVVTS